MAKPKVQALVKKIERAKVARPGRHSKKKSSKLKTSKNYTKKYKSQLDNKNKQLAETQKNLEQKLKED